MFDVKLDLSDVDAMLEKRGLLPGGEVQKFIDQSVLDLSRPYVPFDTGVLSDSGDTSTDIGSGQVIYETPYARKMYYNPQFNFQGAPMRGAFWAERMLADRLDDIVEGAAKIAGGRAK